MFALMRPMCLCRESSCALAFFPGRTSLAALADFVHLKAQEEEARSFVAHSASSIIATLVAGRPQSPIDTVISLQGNITADDAYYSGSAEDFADPQEFKSALLDRIGDLSRSRPIFGRYYDIVSRATALDCGNSAATSTASRKRRCRAKGWLHAAVELPTYLTR